MNPHRTLTTTIGFNSRTRVGATGADTDGHSPLLFQFTHPCGCDTFDLILSQAETGFNSRTRVGATLVSCPIATMRPVSIHAPVWVRHLLQESNRDTVGFQFTHPCGCDKTFGLSGKLRRVSIHAPVWVRLLSINAATGHMPFQFTHPCGCDFTNHYPANAGYCFNSRTRVGATDEELELIAALAVSIHAPVWVRHDKSVSYSSAMLFQFTHPCGCDAATLSLHNGLVQFQFTHPCGCDRCASFVSTTIRCFNSRTRVGATNRQLACPPRSGVSIHAPVWVRLFCGQSCAVGDSFNSRTRVGATTISRWTEQLLDVSIHAPVWVRRPDEYGLSIKHATKVLRQPDARTRCGQA